MKKVFIIILFITSLSSNAHAGRADLIIEFFSWIGKAFETREVMIVARVFPRWFLKDKESEKNFRENTIEDFNLEFDEYIQKKGLIYDQDLNNISDYDFNINPNEEQRKSLSILKNYLISNKYKNFSEEKFVLFCEYKNQIYSFIFYTNKNYVVMNKSTTPFRFLSKKNIPTETLIGIPSKTSRNADVLIFGSIKSEAEKSFENEYYFFLFNGKLKFIYNEGVKGNPKFQEIDTESYETDRCEIEPNYITKVLDEN